MDRQDNTAAEKSPRRRGRDRHREFRKDSRAISPAHYRKIRNPHPPMEVFSADQIEAIHQTSLRVLQEIGIRVLLPEARRAFKLAGAEVDEDSQMVRFDPDLVLQTVARAPPRIHFHARNPERSVEVGEEAVAFVTVGGPPNASDSLRGRHAGDLADYGDFLRLAQSFDVVHCIGAPVEPIDVPVNERHLEMAWAQLTLSDKLPFLFSRGPDAVAQFIEMVRIARGVTAEQLLREPSVYTVVNMNSPLQLDGPMSQGIMDMARAGQVTVVTPFTLAGAMAPITLPGALVQQNAEALAGIALGQIVRPGVPMVYGGFTSNVDMKSGAPAFGTPEYTKAAIAGGQLARRYGLPYRSSNVNASNAPDAQAAYESQMSLWGALMGGCNMLMHGAGWLEGGLTASFEKFIIDVEMLQMMAEFLTPSEVTEETLGFEAIRDVGPGGHFFGTDHTLARFDRAFYAPLLSDWRNFETWEEAGSLDATQRAHQIYKDTLAAFEPPPMDPAVQEELAAYMALRKEEGGAKVD